MDVSSYLVGAAVVIWVIARQFAGRWVPARRTLLLPLVLVVVGVGHAGNVHWTALAVAVVGADAVLTAGLGALRGSAIRLTLREGYLYQRGGWPSVGLWALTGAGEFWPAWVLVPWGTAFGAHFYGSRTLRRALGARRRRRVGWL